MQYVPPLRNRMSNPSVRCWRGFVEPKSLYWVHALCLHLPRQSSQGWWYERCLRTFLIELERNGRNDECETKQDYYRILAGSILSEICQPRAEAGPKPRRAGLAALRAVFWLRGPRCLACSSMQKQHIKKELVMAGYKIKWCCPRLGRTYACRQHHSRILPSKIR